MSGAQVTSSDPLMVGGRADSSGSGLEENGGVIAGGMVGGAGEADGAGVEAEVEMREGEKGLDEFQLEVIELFVGAAKMLGLPRSVGEIYGLLYMEPEPLCLDDLQGRLGLSRGSVSQGLRMLREFGAVRSAYLPGQRKDFVVPETELRRLLSGFLTRQVRPHLESGKDRLGRLDGCAEAGIEQERLAHYAQRVGKLAQWHGRAGKLLPFLERFSG